MIIRATGKWNIVKYYHLLDALSPDKDPKGDLDHFRFMNESWLSQTGDAKKSRQAGTLHVLP